MKQLALEYRRTDRLVPYAQNSRTHDATQIAQIAASIEAFGFTNPILIDPDGGIIAGHGRVMAAKQLGLSEVPTITLGHLSEEQRRAYVIADNRLALDAGWDFELLALEIGELQAGDFDVSLLGFSEEELKDILGPEEGGGAGGGEGPSGAGSLAEKFLIPPFSVLNARDGWWQDRKRAWIDRGIVSEIGRGENLLGMSDTIRDPDGSRGMNPKGRNAAKGAVEPVEGGVIDGGTSIFDPVLCELAYRWWSPAGGVVLDPFAGGSVRGIIAAECGRQYFGIDLREEQVEANREQAETILGAAEHKPMWITGDSRDVRGLVGSDLRADFLFSCPPYADLEVYSDDPRDISTMKYPEFIKAYRQIIAESCALLAPDSFACFVVGEVRDPKGIYRNFVGDTIAAFIDAGLKFYNEAILVTVVGNLPLRVGRSFSTTRKLGKTHQNVLVFVKGDPKKATARCGDVVVPPEALGEFETGEEEGA
jgi:hypothetical protein